VTPGYTLTKWKQQWRIGRSGEIILSCHRTEDWMHLCMMYVEFSKQKSDVTDLTQATTTTTANFSWRCPRPKSFYNNFKNTINTYLLYKFCESFKQLYSLKKQKKHGPALSTEHRRWPRSGITALDRQNMIN